MFDKLLSTNFANWTGGSTVILSIWFKSMEWFNIANVNDILVLFTTLGGLVFLFFKIKSVIIENKIKRLELKKRLEELDK
jgi:hypothetical protein|tara:strand:+ start:1964 stop:2203 length:240 start_codon:yes stop_codon:yes gene_type:complete